MSAPKEVYDCIRELNAAVRRCENAGYTVELRLDPILELGLRETKEVRARIFSLIPEDTD